MIYILGKECINESDELDDVVTSASTDIKDILDYLSLENMTYFQMLDNTILIKENGSRDYFLLRVSKNMIDNLEKYPSKILLNNEIEYTEMKRKVSVWCSKISKEMEEQERLEKEMLQKITEERERKMYEKLKKKYGNE